MVYQELPEHRVFLVLLVPLDYHQPLVLLDYLVLPVLLDFLEQLVHLDYPLLLVPLVLLV